MSRGPIAALSALLLAVGSDLHAEALPALTRGSRVRVVYRADHQRSIKGTLLAWDAKQITLQQESASGPVVMDRQQVIRLDISTGRGRKKAAAIGALIGVSLAAALSFSEPEDICSGSGCLALFGVSSVVLGGAGAGVGALVAPERWRNVSLAAGSRSSIVAKGHIGVALLSAPRGSTAVVVSCRF